MVIRFVFDHTEGPIKFMLASKNPNQSKNNYISLCIFIFNLKNLFHTSIRKVLDNSNLCRQDRNIESTVMVKLPTIPFY